MFSSAHAQATPISSRLVLYQRLKLEKKCQVFPTKQGLVHNLSLILIFREFFHLAEGVFDRFTASMPCAFQFSVVARLLLRKHPKTLFTNMR